MNWNWKEYNREKTLFKSYYCAGCKQTKPCQLLTGWDSKWKNYCCECYFQSKQEGSQEYSNYQKIYQQKVKEKKAHDRQLGLLKDYQGCQDCKSKEVDAYSLYENNRLVCQSCRMRKEGGSSNPISFLELRKWYKGYWGMDLTECLEKFSCLPVNADCARKWVKDKEHLNNCRSLEVEVKEIYELFAGSLQRNQEKLKECKCVKSEKTHTPYYDSKNYGYTYCEKCEAEVKGAGKMGVIKNRNNPSFWGLNIKEKVLCLNCLGKFQGNMPISKRYTFNKYLKRRY